VESEILREEQDSEKTLATPLYSTYALELESAGCLLEDQEMRFITEKHTITRGRTVGVGTSTPINISI
jgi:hypothetical protein